MIPEGHGIESHIRLCTEHVVCLRFSLSLPLPISPTRACSLSLSLSLSLKLKKKGWKSIYAEKHVILIFKIIPPNYLTYDLWTSVKICIMWSRHPAETRLEIKSTNYHSSIWQRKSILIFTLNIRLDKKEELSKVIKKKNQHFQFSIHAASGAKNELLLSLL